VSHFTRGLRLAIWTARPELGRRSTQVAGSRGRRAAGCVDMRRRQSTRRRPAAGGIRLVALSSLLPLTPMAFVVSEQPDRSLSGQPRPSAIFDRRGATKHFEAAAAVVSTIGTVVVVKRRGGTVHALVTYG
jgi:hypothetical protein